MNHRIYTYSILKFLLDNMSYDKYIFLQQIHRKTLIDYLETFYALIKMKHFTASKNLIKFSLNNS